MRLPTKLGKEPLLEAIFELRFSSKIPASSILPGQVFMQIGEPRAIERLPAADVPLPIRQADPNLNYAPLIKVQWESYSILIGDKNVALSCSRPYPGWRAFKPRIIALMDMIKASGVVEKVQRYSVKYTDLLPAELGDADSLIDLDFRIGTQQAKRTNFQIRSEFEESGIIHVLQIVSNAVAMQPNGKPLQGIAIDVDSIVKVSDLDFNSFAQDFDNRSEAVHTASKTVFFSCLKQAALEKLEPTYE